MFTKTNTTDLELSAVGGLPHTPAGDPTAVVHHRGASHAAPAATTGFVHVATPSADAPSRLTRSAEVRRKLRCAAACTRACWCRAACGVFGALTFALAVAGLALAVRLWRPEVQLTRSPRPPYGYRYGGALAQGSGGWVTNKPALPAPRSDLGSVLLEGVPGPLGGSILLLGGHDVAQTVQPTAWAFDPVLETYNTSVAAMPAPRYRFGLALVSSRYVIVAGGMTSWEGGQVKDVAVFDACVGTWSTSVVPPLNFPRSDLACAGLGSVAYCVGGYGANYDMTVTGTLLEVYDVAAPANAWKIGAPLSVPRGDLVAVAASGRLWAIGGWNDGDATHGPGGDFQAAVEGYDPVARTWAPYESLPLRKGDAGVTVYRGQVMVVGGEQWSGAFVPCDWDPTVTCKLNQVPTHDALAFLPDMPSPGSARDDADSIAGNATRSGGASGGRFWRGSAGPRGVWIPRAPMPGARFRFTAAASDVAQSIFVFGGTREGSRVIADVTAYYDTPHPPVFVHYRDDTAPGVVYPDSGTSSA